MGLIVNFSDFENISASGLTLSDYIIGYKSGPNREIRTTIADLINFLESASANDLYLVLSPNSAKWNSTYSTVNSLSDSWEESVFITPLQVASAKWDGTYTTVSTNSSTWIPPNLTEISTSSGSWNSVYTTTGNNSAFWNDVYTNVATTSAARDSVYTTTRNNSALWSNWSTVSANYALGNQYVKLSGDIMSGSLSASSLSASFAYLFNSSAGTAAITPKLYINDTSGIGYPELFTVQANDASDPLLRFRRTGATAGNYVFMLRGGPGSTWMAINDNSVFDQQLIIHSNGNVGINNTSPSTKLHVGGTITATGGNSNQWNSAYSTLNANSANWSNVSVLSTNATFLSISADNFDIYNGKILNVRSGANLRINFESSLPAGFNLSVLNETTFNVTLTSSVDGVYKSFGTVLSGSNGAKNLYSSATVYKYGTNVFAIGSLI